MTTARDFCAAVNPAYRIPGALVNNPIQGDKGSLIGKEWDGAAIKKLTLLRNDNADQSQRQFTHEVLADFPGRTYWGVYHQVRYVDMLIAAESAPIVAVEIG